MGAHTAATGSDIVAVGGFAGATESAPTLRLTGAAIGDQITFLADTANAIAGVTVVAAGGSVAATIAALEGTLTAHTVYTSVFGGNTYVMEATVTGGATGATSLISLVGNHTFTAGAAGTITLAS